jgi:hypothetical protein
MAYYHQMRIKGWIGNFNALLERESGEPPGPRRLLAPARIRNGAWVRSESVLGGTQVRTQEIMQALHALIPSSPTDVSIPHHHLQQAQRPLCNLHSRGRDDIRC